MSAYDLPTSIRVGSVICPIRSDFRAVLDILAAQMDPELDDEAKAFVLLRILYEQPDQIPPDHLQEAYEKAVAFIDAGMKDDGKPSPRLMDWEQDAPLILPAVNRVAGTEIRALQYLHWWTFLGYYMEIGESYFSSVLDIRIKKSKKKKLEKYEKEFYQEHRNVIDLKMPGSERSEEEKEELRKLFGLTK